MQVFRIFSALFRLNQQTNRQAIGKQDEPEFWILTE